MTNMIHIENTIGVNSDGIIRVIAIWDALLDHGEIVLAQPVGKQLIAILVVLNFDRMDLFFLNLYLLS